MFVIMYDFIWEFGEYEQRNKSIKVLANLDEQIMPGV